MVDPEIAAFIEALDPAALTDADFDGLLLAAGLAGGDGIAVPERMADVNAMLDLASPADARGAAGRVPRPAAAADSSAARERQHGVQRVAPGVGADALRHLGCGRAAELGRTA